MEYFGDEQEIMALDFKVEVQALYAIRKWIIPSPPPPNWKETPTGRYQRKEACRYLLTKNIAFSGVWLPGIEGTDHSPEAMEIYNRESQAFHLLLWSELFPGEPYVPADLSQYRQRVDHEFAWFPDFPEKWGVPEYRPW